MLIDKVCGLNELEMSFGNKDSNLESKKEMINRKLKSAHEFQSVFEYEIKKWRNE